ncbi:beta-xylosidase/alpha-L-arabinofuranosidase 1-like [Durio zibethinus]|uniref:Beta-xylosidase/alpha-L-arabinofuranosidase 1-like n=1 Tax=Durio zibethinus TaxID=66656 RepID=A0A6P6AHT7_DURZI|nr:beta-xylosidase/alpha-L-arabinofuranosidase 1-like [Durio zibethinus]
MNLTMSEFAYCDKSLPYEVRAKDLVDRMTLPEKVKQMGDNATGVLRIGLPAYFWWSEALHGISGIGIGPYFNELVPGATSFPTVIHTTAAFNRTLWKILGKAVSTEGRAMFNLGNTGLTYWSPVVNPVRDPRWGRITETSGEDPFVSGVYGANYVRGLQDVEGQEQTNNTGSRPLKVSACCKHYAAYDVDNWHGVNRKSFDAKVTEQDMVETFLRPFEICVKDGDVSSIMCSYNRVNGIPTCADAALLKETIRKKWKFNGYIVADCDSVLEMVRGHHFLNDTAEDAVAQALKAGLDLDCGAYYPNHLESSVRQGKVREEEIDTSLKNLYVVLMRLGFFDGSFLTLGKRDICSQEHIELAAEAARQGAVLLKNDATLPLNTDAVKTLAVIGPNANATGAMLGNYAGVPCRYVSPLSALSAFGEVIYEMGCEGVKCPNDKLISKAQEAAKRADATILVMGTDLSIEHEDRDREDLLLPSYQKELIIKVAEASNGPVVLVIMSAGGVDISFAKNNTKIKGILWFGHPGQEGGRGIADVVFGKYNPGGRLPITWYENDYVSKMPMTSMQLRPVDSLGYPGRTYKFFNGSTVYPFGFGLSYTSFSYKLASTNISLPVKLNRLQHCRNVEYTDKSLEQSSCPAVLVDDLTCENEIVFEVEVQNVGDKDGNEVVMVYSKPPEGIVRSHIKQVVGFERVFVAAKQSQKVKFALNACDSLRIVDDKGYILLPSGLHKIILGTESIDVNVSYVR